ncbi:hypothetical protein H0H93_012498 [Arthromyces matolae]|nr:hypothetical protein H0H93_012498 [Arthromyces matolae]
MASGNRVYSDATGYQYYPDSIYNYASTPEGAERSISWVDSANRAGSPCDASAFTIHKSGSDTLGYVDSPAYHQLPPIHAPAPLVNHASILLSSPDAASSTYTTSDDNFNLNQHQVLSPSLETLQSESYEPMPDTKPSATRPPQATFPTPSAMLTELVTSSRPSSLMTQSSAPKCETVRRARRRVMAQTIGFEPTDPDIISSHEKKRNYLECLEYYVTYLHEQLNLIGCVPARLQRPSVSIRRGMTSQSIRTLLVHMEHLTRRLNQEMQAEESRFIYLHTIASQVQGHMHPEGQVKSTMLE